METKKFLIEVERDFYDESVDKILFEILEKAFGKKFKLSNVKENV